MTERTQEGVGAASPHLSARADRRLRRRYAADRRFRLYGAGAIALALGALAVLLGTVVSDGVAAFVTHEVTLEIAYDADRLGLDPTALEEGRLGRANYQALVKASLRQLFPQVQARGARRKLSNLVSEGAGYDLRERVLADPGLLGTIESVALPLASEAIEQLEKGESLLDADQVGWLATLGEQGRVQRVFNRRFFSGGDSREPELAGIWGAAKGSLLTLFVTLMLSFPVGVAAAVYLEEFASRNRFTDFVEVNINNLAAVPSIVFGLLGLAVFLNLWGMPRSAPLVGGIVLALMTLPTVIIAARTALSAVPPSIREAALGVGASPLQTITHHVLPLAMPGILTGSIIGMARALGETAPLLMIGMVAFIVDVPEGPTSPSTVLPVQIFLWADSPERGFVEKTSGAILVLLAFLIAMNLAAVLLRNRFERRW